MSTALSAHSARFTVESAMTGGTKGAWWLLYTLLLQLAGIPGKSFSPRAGS